MECVGREVGRDAGREGRVGWEEGRVLVLEDVCLSCQVFGLNHVCSPFTGGLLRCMVFCLCFGLVLSYG